ncbi:MAG TPA: enoyl-ACP reductase [Oligoflexia bacterium]|nr:enoyl-ACP reductase [Oligoflexia bacterium]HMP26471.1 enoyl-ACP reductase [Oligoflexia bacterium]
MSQAHQEQKLAGQRFLVLGVANERSIAWAIAESLAKEGAELCLTYANEAIEKRVKPLAEQLGCKIVLKCDVQSDQEIIALFRDLKERWGKLNGVVHSLAFADKADLDGRFVNTSRAGFKLALDVSAYSLIALARETEPLMKDDGGSILTLTYLGSERVVKNYNVMGVAKAALECSMRYLAAELGESQIRINAISAGPIKTLAASGIPQFREMLTAFAAKAPLRRNVSQEEVAQVAMFYLSPMSKAITGEVTFVDCGYSIVD